MLILSGCRTALTSLGRNLPASYSRVPLNPLKVLASTYSLHHCRGNGSVKSQRWFHLFSKRGKEIKKIGCLLVNDFWGRKNFFQGIKEQILEVFQFIDIFWVCYFQNTEEIALKFYLPASLKHSNHKFQSLISDITWFQRLVVTSPPAPCRP